MPINSRPLHALSLAMVLCLLSISTREARAHFLFVRIGPVAEGGRSAEVYFSEFAKAGDPRFIPKLANTKLWVQTTPGEFREIQVQAGADRLRSILPADQTLGVVGECRYGVLSRPKQPPFLLRHYPKAVAGRPEAINRLTRRPETPFEIVATILPKKTDGSSSGDRNQTSLAPIRLTALRNGKPMPKIEFHSVAADLTEVKFAADAEGSATWTPPSSGQYCFYVADVLKESGELDGKHYDEIRDFATLTVEWPLEPVNADPEAMALFQKAIAKRSQWRHFPGFSADIQGDLDGRAYSGKVTISAKGDVDLEVDDDAARPWLREHFDSLVTHRIPREEAPQNSSAPQNGHAGFTMRFGDDPDEHPLGRLLLVNGGRMASSYRIKDDQISVVNRNLGKQSMTLLVLRNDLNADGLSLPRSYVVNYWDGATGRLIRAETFQEGWTRTGDWDLPLLHTVSTSSDGGLSIRTLNLSKHVLLKKP